MPITAKVKPTSVREKTVQTKFGQKPRFYLWCEGIDKPFGTWSSPFASALKEYIGQTITISYEEQGAFQNLVVPEKFQGEHRSSGDSSSQIITNTILGKIEELNTKMDKVIEFFANKS